MYGIGSHMRPHYYRHHIDVLCVIGGSLTCSPQIQIHDNF